MGYTGCLAHAVIGMFYSVVANRRQPQHKYNIIFYSVGANRGQLLYTWYVLRGGGGYLILYDGVYATGGRVGHPGTIPHTKSRKKQLVPYRGEK